MLTRHEIPTHLEVEDKVLWSLTARQLLIIAISIALGYALFQRSIFIPFPIGKGWMVPLAVRVILGSIPSIVGFLMAFVRPDGRTFDAWLMARARYQTLPKICVWRRLSAPPDTDDVMFKLLLAERDQQLIGLSGNDAVTKTVPVSTNRATGGFS